MRTQTAYNGDAGVYENGKKVRVTIEAPNVRAEVYIDKTRAAEIRDELDHILRFWPRSERHG